MNCRDLEGAFYPLDSVELTREGWFSGSFQAAFTPWLEEHIGMRACFVRMFNQYRYTVYREPTANGCMVGKDRVLYHTNYYEAYIGKGSVGRKRAREQMVKMKAVQDSLAARGKALLYAMAAGKASVYPEFLPGHLQRPPCDTSNHRLMAELATELNVNHIDFTKWFLSLKDSVSYPLFPKAGVHWSGYGATLVADTLFRALENIAGKDLRDFTILPGYETRSDFVWSDDDIERSFNLVFPLRAWPMYYPDVRFDPDSSKRKDKILIIGDSFSQSFFAFDDYFNNLFTEDSRFWPGYSYSMWYDQNGNEVYHSWEIDKDNLLEQIDSFDYILIITTEIHAGELGFGFIEDLYDQLLDY